MKGTLDKIAIRIFYAHIRVTFHKNLITLGIPECNCYDIHFAQTFKSLFLCIFSEGRKKNCSQYNRDIIEGNKKNDKKIANKHFRSLPQFYYFGKLRLWLLDYNSFHLRYLC